MAPAALTIKVGLAPGAAGATERSDQVYQLEAVSDRKRTVVHTDRPSLADAARPRYGSGLRSCGMDVDRNDSVQTMLDA